MYRRRFTQAGAGMVAVGGALTAPDFHASRRFADTRFGRIAFVERGTGPAALFLHGYPLNGFHWRGALDRLSSHRRCIAPDFMGLGYTETSADQDLSPGSQADMLATLLDALSVDRADLVANDSGGAVAQLLIARYPERVRTVLFTNCDVHQNSPPAALRPVIEAARAGALADQFIGRHLSDPAFAESAEGLGGLAYTDPANLTREAIECYFVPLLGSVVRKAQFHRYATSFDPNPLPAIEQALRRSTAPVRVVWGRETFSSTWAGPSGWIGPSLPRAVCAGWRAPSCSFPRRCPT